MDKASWIYVLKLKKGKYYVGKTNNPKARLAQHTKKQGGAAWTRKYPVLKRVELFPSTSAFDENNVTKWYMKMKGIDRVRGGAYCQLDLDPKVVEFLEHEFKSLDDSCYRCGEKGHFEYQCALPAKDIPLPEVAESSSESSDEDTCSRCGREGHSKKQCYAVRNVNGKFIVDEEDDDNNFDPSTGCGRCGRNTHEKKDCYATVDINGIPFFDESSDDEMEIEILCERCGREGHEKQQCFAKIDIRGRWISDKKKSKSKKAEKETKKPGLSRNPSNLNTSTTLNRSQSNLTKAPPPSNLSRSQSNLTRGQSDLSLNDKKQKREDDKGGPPTKRLKQSQPEVTLSCRRCGRDSHTEENCYAKTVKPPEPTGCARCGRSNHTAQSCYASTHENGQRLPKRDK